MILRPFGGRHECRGSRRRCWRGPCVPMNDETALGAKLVYNSGEWLERRHRRRCGRAGSPADGDSVRQVGAPG